MPRPAPRVPLLALSLPPRAAVAIAPAPPAAAVAVTARPLLLRRTRRRVLRPLDQLLRLDEPAVLMLRDELEADPAASLVDLLNDDVHDVAAAHHVLDVRDPARADVRDVQEPVSALLQLDEGAELRRLDDLAGERVADLRLLRQRLD